MPSPKRLFPIAIAAAMATFLPAFGQTIGALQVFHPPSAMPSYEVVTIKKAAGPQPMTMGGPMRTTMRNYILNAYGMSSLQQMRVVGGPAWLDTDQYDIQGKPSNDLRDAMKGMTSEERWHQDQMLMRSMLADRFKLKAHIETRELPIFELVPAKGGLKIKEVPPFVPPAPGTPLPPRAPGAAMQPGMISMQSRDGKTVLNAGAATMGLLINLLMGSSEVGGRSILNKTGFTGSFDIVGLTWAGLAVGITGQAAAVPTGETDAPSLFTALEDSLGLKLQATKGMVEVVVIDSIERPSEN